MPAERLGYADSGKRQPLPSRAPRVILGALRRVWRGYAGLPPVGSTDLFLAVWLDGEVAARVRVDDLPLMREVFTLPVQIVDVSDVQVHVLPAVVVQVEETPVQPHW